MGVNIVQPTVDFTKIGQRIKAARLEKGLNQSELGELVGCSNNHMSHVEVGQTKVSWFRQDKNAEKGLQKVHSSTSTIRPGGEP